jgi:2-(3-amino-3-carboxypropyl)histidine synthase
MAPQIDAWVQIACPRLSVDWGHFFDRPVLTSYELEVAMGQQEWRVRAVVVAWKGWVESCCQECTRTTYRSTAIQSTPLHPPQHPHTLTKPKTVQETYPMDYYAKDGGPWGNMHPGDNAKRVLP